MHQRGLLLVPSALGIRSLSMWTRPNDRRKSLAPKATIVVIRWHLMLLMSLHRISISALLHMVSVMLTFISFCPCYGHLFLTAPISQGRHFDERWVFTGGAIRIEAGKVPDNSKAKCEFSSIQVWGWALYGLSDVELSSTKNTDWGPRLCHCRVHLQVVEE